MQIEIKWEEERKLGEKIDTMKKESQNANRRKEKERSWNDKQIDGNKKREGKNDKKDQSGEISARKSE